MSSFYTNVYARGDRIYLRGFENGKRADKIINYEPYVFVRNNGTKNTLYRSLDGRPFDKFDFPSISDARKFIKDYSDVENMDIYGLTNFPYLFIYDNYTSDIQYDFDHISIVSLDIETDASDGFPDIDTANREINAITISRKGKKVVFGFYDYKPESEDVEYIRCSDEYTLLRNFIETWSGPSFNPDIVTGWHIEGFDIPYLVNRIIKILGNDWAKKLSPWGLMEDREIRDRDRVIKTEFPVGVAVIDYMLLYKKFSFKNQESYKLDFIAEEELKVKKIDYSEYGTLHDLYTKNFQKYITYNIRDVDLIDMLEDKLRFIEQVIAFAYDARVNYVDTFTTVRLWDIIIHNYLMNRKIVIPPMKNDNQLDTLVGGYVKDPRVGMNKWVVSFDLTSLYPSLIQQYNISKESLVPKRTVLKAVLKEKAKRGLI